MQPTRRPSRDTFRPFLSDLDVVFVPAVSMGSTPTSFGYDADAGEDAGSTCPLTKYLTGDLMCSGVELTSTGKPPRDSAVRGLSRRA